MNKNEDFKKNPRRKISQSLGVALQIAKRKISDTGLKLSKRKNSGSSATVSTSVEMDHFGDNTTNTVPAKITPARRKSSVAAAEKVETISTASGHVSPIRKNSTSTSRRNSDGGGLGITNSGNSSKSNLLRRNSAIITDSEMKSSRGPNERKISESVSTYLVNLSEELKMLLHPEGLQEPELIVGLSEILDIDEVRNLKELTLGSPSWHLTYSTSLDHHSLNGLYKKLAQFQHINDNENLLILIKDTDKHVFGVLFLSAMTKRKNTNIVNTNDDDLLFTESSSPEIVLVEDSDDAEQNHTTFFHCRPFKQFVSCLGERSCIVRKYVDAFYIGYKDVGTCGLWLNEDLSSGRIHEFNFNDTESHEYNFDVKTLECWSFSYNNNSNVINDSGITRF